MAATSRLVKDMSITDYHADHAVSKSGLKLLLDKTPAHYFYEYRTAGVKKAVPSPQKIFGQALHTMVLEQDKFSTQYIQAPAINKNTVRYKAFKIEAAAAGKIILDAVDMDRLADMRAKLYAHPEAIQFLPGSHQGDNLLIEASFFWDEEVVDAVTGETALVRCKCRPDIVLKPSGLRPADLKSTRSAKYEDFMKDAFNYGYHIQEASYTSGLNKLEEGTVEDFTFIAQESSAPYPIALYTLSEAYKQLGYIHFRQGLSIVAECEKTNTWPSYPLGAQTLELSQRLMDKYTLNPLQEEYDGPQEDFIIG